MMKTMIERDMGKHNLPIVKIENWKGSTPKLNKIQDMNSYIPDGEVILTQLVSTVVYLLTKSRKYSFLSKKVAIFCEREIRCNIIVSI